MSVSAAIVGNGDFPLTEYPRYLLESSDIVVCCDGAVDTYVSQYPDRLPDMVVGDMDSAARSFLSAHPDRCTVVKDQETNDQTKAFEWLLANCPDLSAIRFIASTGKRVDHTIANLSLLMEYAVRLEGLYGRDFPKLEAVGDFDCFFPMLDSGSFFCGEGRRVSIFSPDASLRIKSDGLVWPTDDVIFDNWWKATLNRSLKDEVTLHFNHPSKALIATD